MDIRAWLQVARTREQTFRNNESDRRILPELTADDLKELGSAQSAIAGGFKGDRRSAEWSWTCRHSKRL
jgi:hypothetical protein